MINSYTEQVLSQTTVIVNFERSGYVDLNSISDPIQNYDFHSRFSYQWQNIKIATMGIALNEVYLEDDLFPVLFETEYREFMTFKGLTETDTAYSFSDPTNNGVIIAVIHLDNKVNQYKRKVMNFYEVLGLVGGIFELLEISLGFVVATANYFTIKKEMSVYLVIRI